jgi:hypothetical protein
MDDDDGIILFLLTSVAAAHQLIYSYYILFDDLPTVKKKKQQLLKRKWELTPYKHNVSCRYSTATLPLEPKNCLAEILQDSNRAQNKSVTHLPVLTS